MTTDKRDNDQKYVDDVKQAQELVIAAARLMCPDGFVIIGKNGTALSVMHENVNNDELLQNVAVLLNRVALEAGEEVYRMARD